MIKYKFLFYYFVLFFTLLSSNTIDAQSHIDSLQNQLIKENDYRKQASLYYDIADFYYDTNIDSSILYAKHYLEASKELKDTSWIADAYNFIAYAYDQKGEVELALEYFEKALDEFLLLKDSFYIASTYTNIGYMTSYGMDQAKGLNYFLEAMQIAEEVNDPGLLSDISSNIAYYYYRVNDNKTAYRYYKYSLDNSILVGDSIYIAVGYANLGDINVKMEDFDEALENFLKSKQFLPCEPNDYDYANYCLSVGSSYVDWKKADSAQIYINRAEQIINENKFQILEAYLYQNKGNLAFLNNEYNDCIKYSDTSIILFTEINTIEPFLDIYIKKAEAYSKLKQYERAYITLHEANDLYKSLGYGVLGNMLGEFDQKRNNRIRQKNKDLENNLIKQKEENYKISMKAKMRLAVSSIISLFCFLAIVLYFWWRIRRKNKTLRSHNIYIENQKALVEDNVKKLELSERNFKDLNATKDKFFSIIGHDLKNPFSSLSGLTEVLITNKEIRESDKMMHILQTMHETAGYGYTLLSDLLEWAQSQTGIIKAKPEKLLLNNAIRKVVTDFISIADDKNIMFDLQVQSSTEVLADQNMLNTILRNLIHNALKFSYENGIIKIHSYVKEDYIITSIEDQGIGISEKELTSLFAIDNHLQKLGTKDEKGSGLGLILCKDFVTKNNGDIWAEGEDNKGCKFSFSLPLYKNN